MSTASSELVATLDTIGSLISAGRGMKGKCTNCDRERSFSSAAVVALALGRELTLEQAGKKLRCRVCSENAIELKPAPIDPQAPLSPPRLAWSGA